MPRPGSAGGRVAPAPSRSSVGSQLHQQPLLPQELLDPSLLPIALLRNPSQWSPEDSGLDPVDLLACHRDLTDTKQLLSSGRLGEIALGQRSLFTDLPPVHLQAYRDGLRPAAREGSLSALEHLSSIGRQRFQERRPLGMDLDRYQPRSQTQLQVGPSPQRPRCWWFSTQPNKKQKPSRRAALNQKGGTRSGTPPRGSLWMDRASPPDNNTRQPLPCQ